MHSTLDQQLAAFLRKQRGTMTYEQFSKKLGVAQSTLFRLEQGQQSITLNRLQQILTRLKCRMAEIFPDPQ